MEIAIIVICVLLLAALAAAVVMKAIALAKQMRRYKAELEGIARSDKYLLDIVQDGKTVRVECKDVNSNNVEFIPTETVEE